jgi:3-oxoadipate enol-lactonase
MAFARLNGIDFYYEGPAGGPGPRLLFLNGTGGDLRQKPSFIDGPLASEFEILAHDQRGLGQSGKPDVEYSMADYADDAAALLDHVGWDRCHVFGVSFGGMVAQEFALRHPGRVDRLVLACTSSGGAGGASYPLQDLAKLEPEEYMKRIVAIGDTRWGDESVGRGDEALEKVLEFMKIRRRVPSTGEGPEAISAGARRQIEARIGHDTWDRLPKINAETLLCGGRYDGIAAPENMENLARRIPSARLEFFEGGHGFLFEDRSAFGRIIEFLKRGS